VHTLKRLIRGNISKSHNDSGIDQSISDGYMLHQGLMVMEVKHNTRSDIKQTPMTRLIQTQGQFPELTRAPALTLPQGR
jgi:hypothetical protein